MQLPSCGQVHRKKPTVFKTLPVRFVSPLGLCTLVENIKLLQVSDSRISSKLIVDSSRTGELHLKAMFYVYLLRQCSTLLKLSTDNLFCLQSDVQIGLFWLRVGQVIRHNSLWTIHGFGSVATWTGLWWKRWGWGGGVSSQTWALGFNTYIKEYGAWIHNSCEPPVSHFARKFVSPWRRNGRGGGGGARCFRVRPACVVVLRVCPSQNITANQCSLHVIFCT